MNPNVETTRDANLPRSVEWRYHRPGGTSCKRTQEFLATNEIETVETRSATRNPVLQSQVPELLAGIDELVVAKGRKVVRIDLAAEDRPPDEALAAMMVSRWGRLRAPAMRVGATFVIGYNQDILASVFATETHR